MEWKKIDPFAKPFGTVTRKKIEYKKDNLECFGVSELRILLYTRLVTMKKVCRRFYLLLLPPIDALGSYLLGKKLQEKLKLKSKLRRQKVCVIT